MPSDRSLLSTGTFQGLVAAAVVVLLGLGFVLLHTLNINWDEFASLTRVYRFLEGGQVNPLQSFVVLFFLWVPDIGGTEVDQVIGARYLVYAFHAGSAALLFIVAARFFGTQAGLLATLCFVSFSYVVEHGSSFRHDPLALFFGLAATVLLTGRSLNVAAAFLSGLLFALSLTLTIKSLVILALPAAWLVYTAGEGAPWRATAARLLVFSTTAAAGFVLLNRWYAGYTGTTTANLVRKMGEAGTTFLQPENLETRLYYLLESVRDDFIVWLAIIVGALYGLALFIDNRRPGDRRRAAGILLLVSPVAAFVFYRNMFPYFYVMLMPILLVLAGGALAWIRRDMPARKAAVILLLLAAGIFTSGLANTLAHLPGEQGAQRKLLAGIHRMFPEPVPYLDRCTMVSSFPEAGFFMTSAGLARYRQLGLPLLGSAIHEARPRFVLANNRALLGGLAGYDPDTPARHHLHREDIEALRANYVHHWELVYVAGKSLVLDDTGPQDFDIIIDGTYTVESAAPVQVDGKRFDAGDTLHLGPGRHTAQGTLPRQPLVLRWGKQLLRPAERLDGRLFTGF